MRASPVSDIVTWLQTVQTASHMSHTIGFPIVCKVDKGGGVTVLPTCPDVHDSVQCLRFYQDAVSQLSHQEARRHVDHSHAFKCFGLLGILKYYGVNWLGVITSVKFVGWFLSGGVYAITGVTFVPTVHLDDVGDLMDPFEKILSEGDFYFACHLDLTRRLQDLQCCNSVRMCNCGCMCGVDTLVPRSEWLSVSRFWWNEWLWNNMLAMSTSPVSLWYRVVCIHGFVGIHGLSAAEGGVIGMLISRISCGRAGTRFLRRM